MMDGGVATSIEELQDMVNARYKPAPRIDAIALSASRGTEVLDPTGKLVHFYMFPDNRLIFFFEVDMPPVMVHIFTNGVLSAGLLMVYDSVTKNVQISAVLPEMLEQVGRIKPIYYLKHHLINNIHFTDAEIKEADDSWHSYRQVKELGALTKDWEGKHLEKPRYS